MTSKTKRKKHLLLRILVIVFILLVLLCSALYLWQRHNIEAVVDATKYSKEDIQQQMADTKDEATKTLEEYGAPVIRDFTPEEEEQIRKGELSVDDAMSRILEEGGATSSEAVVSDGNSANSNVSSESNQADNNADSNVVSSTSVPNKQSTSSVSSSSGNNVSSSTTGAESKENTTKVDDARSIVSEYAVELYKLKAVYLGQIGNVVDQAKAERKSGESLSSIASKYIGELGSLESEADSKVDATLDQMKSKLAAVGADTSIADTMKSSYEKEKSLKKAYYLSLYNEKKQKVK